MDPEIMTQHDAIYLNGVFDNDEQLTKLTFFDLWKYVTGRRILVTLKFYVAIIFIN